MYSQIDIQYSIINSNVSVILFFPQIACYSVVLVLSIVTVLAVIVYDLCGCARLDYIDLEQERLEQRLDLSQNP